MRARPGAPRRARCAAPRGLCETARLVLLRSLQQQGAV